MFNKSIVVALIVCACYLGTSDARPKITDLLSGPAGSLVGGALGGAGTGLTTGLTGGLTNAALSPQGALAPVHGVVSQVSGSPGLVG